MVDSNSQENWKIAMLGPKSSGKTCYLGSLYAFHSDVSGQGNSPDFYIKANNALTMGQLREIARDLLATPIRLPEATKGLSGYEISLCLGDTSTEIRRPMTLIDHRGEALAGSDDATEAASFDSIVKALESSDAFIAVVSAEHLLIEDVHAQAHAMNWDRISSILTSVSQRLQAHDFLPIVIAISKSDVLTDKTLERAQQALDNYVAVLSSRLPNACFFICPISVIRTTGTQRKNLIFQTPKYERNLLNLREPFIFSATSVVLRNAAAIAELAKTEDKKRQELTTILKNQGATSFWGMLASIIKNRSLTNLKHRAGIFMLDRSIKRNICLSEEDLLFAAHASKFLGVDQNNGVRFVVNATETSLKDFWAARERMIRL